MEGRLEEARGGCLLGARACSKLYQAVISMETDIGKNSLNQTVMLHELQQCNVLANTKVKQAASVSTRLGDSVLERRLYNKKNSITWLSFARSNTNFMV